MQVKTSAVEAAHADERITEVVRAVAVGVRARRMQRSMSLAGLAFESGLSENTVRAVESGRVAASLATLVAIADTLEVGVGDLFGDAVAPMPVADEVDDPAMRSEWVVPSEAIWGGELPPAPWLTVVPDSPATVSTGGAEQSVAPPEPATTASAPTPAGPAPAVLPTERSWGGSLPPAPWADAPDASAPPSPRSPTPAAAEPSLTSTFAANDYPVQAATAADGEWTVRDPAYVVSVSTPPAHTAAPRVRDVSSARGMRGSSAYVFLAPDAASGPRAEPEPRTFADLRKGILAGRVFPSLREFAVASVVEAGHPVPAIARVFRVPVWRLEQWVTESR